MFLSKIILILEALRHSKWIRFVSSDWDCIRFFAPLIGVAIGNSAHIAGLITGSILAGIDVWRQKR